MRTRRRIPIQLQATPTECGLACLAMISSFHGRATTVSEVRRAIDVGRDGASLKQIKDHAQAEGLVVQAVRCPIEHVPTLPRATLITWTSSHFVVLDRVTSRGVRILDPADGELVVTHEEFAQSYTGVALTFTPGPEFEPRRRSGLGFRRFVAPYVPRARAKLAGLIALGFVLTAVGAIPALLTKVVVDSLVPAGDVGPIGAMVGISAAFALSYLFTGLLRAELLLWLEKRLDASLMAGILDHLLVLPYRYFQQRSTGDLLVRFSSTAYIRDVLSGRLLPMVIDAVFVVVYLAFIAANSLVYAGLILAVIVIQAVVIAAFAAPARRQAEREMAEMSASQSVLLETIRAVETVKSLGTEDQAYRRWGASFARQLDAGARRTRLDNTLGNLLDSVSYIVPVLMLLLGAVMVINGELSLGTMLALNSLAGMALGPVRSIGMNLQVLQTVRVHLARLRDILDENPEDTHEDMPERELRGAIDVENVSFRYGDSSPYVLDGIDCRIRAGEFVAVIGPSGSGKSTLARLLLGLLDPSTGQVRYDGVPMDEMKLSYLRRQCGMVTQDSEVTSGSLLSNIRAGREEVSDEDAVAAAQVAALAEDVAAMPMGFDTPLGESGVGLSGGQRQRLAIARAVAGSPKILVLDEATSHLDAPTEQRITEQLERLPVTRVVIAHRLSTVVNADRIILMRGGRVACSGTHAEMLGQPEYVSFIGNQLGRPAVGALP
ncbi:peptidase domain-containing ABC transporter [Georgenia wangjunii]|uniref:peptidase domain-containing ABC transporter n=1 Tax=Georgenia wangjunii TaxID=3117730 RepID=UPI002F26A400